VQQLVNWLKESLRTDQQVEKLKGESVLGSYCFNGNKKLCE
jgi:hypothetical protein